MDLFDFISLVILIGSFCGIVCIFLTHNRIRKYMQAEDKITLYVFPRHRGIQVPNLCQFSLQLETWLRLNKLDYKVVETEVAFMSTHQWPSVTYNGEEYEDSSLIVELLTTEKCLDSTEGLSNQDRVTSRALMCMMDERLYWSYTLCRYVYQFGQYKERIMKLREAHWLIQRFTAWNFSRKILERAKGHGIGRKTQKEVINIGLQDIKAASKYLGKKQFMMGDEITTVDCSMFGHLSQIVYIDFPLPHKQYIEDHCENLIPYLNRIKAELWPDWDTLVQLRHT